MKKHNALMSLLAFLTVALFIIIYGFCSYADGNTSLSTMYNVSSCLTRDDFNFNDNGFVFDSSASEVIIANNLISSGMNVPSDNSDFEQELNYSHYFLWGGDDDKFYFLPCTDNCFVIVQDYQWGFDLYFNLSDFYNYDSSDSYTDCTTAYFVEDSFSSFQNISFNNNNAVTIDGVVYGVYSIRGAGYNNIIDTDLIISEGTLGTAPSSVPLNGQVNPHYNGSSGSRENSSNNLFLNDCYMVWNTPNYIGLEVPATDYVNMDSSSFPIGKCVFSGHLTDYQIENISKFSLVFTYEIYFDGFCKSSIGADAFHKSFSRTYTTTPLGLNVFHAGNDTISFSFDSIFSTTEFKAFYQNNFINTINMINKTNTFWYMTIDVSMIDDNNNKSGHYVEKYNFMNNRVENLSKTLRTNQNPYVDDDNTNPNGTNVPITNQTSDGVMSTSSSGNGYAGSNSSSGNSSAYGGSPSVNVNTGGVVVNNNTQLTDPKPVVDYVKNELLPSENGFGFVEKLQDVTESNGFITLMSNTFTFIPETVWSDLAFYFSIVLGIMVAGFVLRIILDLL